MIRKIAVDLLKKNKTKEVYIKLTYAVGKCKPVMAIATIDGVEEKIEGYITLVQEGYINVWN
jgi:predicted Rossmann-fold nucleotide-binding protein